MPPSLKLPANSPNFVLALLIGSIGGVIFNYLHMPLAWMLGPMSFCTFAAIVNVPIRPVEQVRPLMTAIIGVLLGAGFTPDLFAGLAGWVPSLLGLAVYILVCAFIGMFYFIKVGKFDRATAFFAAMPGGLVEMMTLGQDKGGNGNLIALVHSARILLVVASLPYVVFLVSGVPVVTSSGVGRVSVINTPFVAEVLLLVCAVAGIYLGRMLRLPAKYLLGPMLVSGVTHLTGISTFQPANEVVIVAQLFLGTLVGCRFARTSPMVVVRVLALSVGSVAMLLAVASLSAVTLSYLSPYSPQALLLAYSPGGLTEMSLVDLSMQIEVAFVAGHHVARVLIVLALGSTLFGWMGKAGVTSDNDR